MENMTRLVECSLCKKPISSNALSCPSCGEKQSEQLALEAPTKYVSCRTCGCKNLVDYSKPNCRACDRSLEGEYYEHKTILEKAAVDKNAEDNVEGCVKVFALVGCFVCCIFDPLQISSILAPNRRSNFFTNMWFFVIAGFPGAIVGAIIGTIVGKRSQGWSK